MGKNLDRDWQTLRGVRLIGIVLLRRVFVFRLCKHGHCTSKVTTCQARRAPNNRCSAATRRFGIIDTVSAAIDLAELRSVAVVLSDAMNNLSYCRHCWTLRCRRLITTQS
jgi:hypothetical protein